jgi:hypothetical protein
MTILRIPANGNGPVAESLTMPLGETYRLVSVTLNLNAAPTTSENFTITLDAVTGPEYDTLLYSLDLAAGATTDLLWQPDGDFFVQGGDQIDVAWTNSNGRTWGLLITAEVV